MKLIKKLSKIKNEYLIFLLAVLYRLPSLGYDFINSDAYHWKERGYAFGSALTSFNFAGTAVTYHPGVPLLWSQFVANKIFSVLTMVGVYGELSPREDFFINHFWQKFVLVIITSILIAWVYKVLRNLVGEKASIIAILLVLLEPFYLGLSRAIHTDVLLSLFMFLSFLYFYKFTVEKGSRAILFSGVFAGLSFLTKSSGLFLIPFMGLWSIFDYFKFRDRRFFIGYARFLAFAVLTFFIAWPAMWVAPISSVNSYIFDGIRGVGLEAGHGHTWFGVETLDPGPLFYPIVFIGRYSMILVTLFVIGVYYWLRNRPRNNILELVQANLVYMLLYLVMITFVSKKLDRYLLPIVFPLAVVASYYLPKILSKKKLGAIVVFFIISRAVLFYGFHPNYLAYYSPLIGGAENGKNIIEPKWPVGYDNAAKYFNKKDNPEEIKVAASEHDYLRPFARFQVLNIQHDVERDEADYFLLPTYRPERNKFYIDNYDLEKSHDVITVAGVEYYEIYKVKGKR